MNRRQHLRDLNPECDDEVKPSSETCARGCGARPHLNGPIAAALMKRAEELLGTSPQIRKATVLADKLPG
jgi:hypothetical protein